MSDTGCYFLRAINAYKMACQDYDGSPFVIIQDLDFDNTLVLWIWKVHSGTAILHILVSLLIILIDLGSV
jgi:hypothetical protein